MVSNPTNESKTKIWQISSEWNEAIIVMFLIKWEDPSIVFGLHIILLYWDAVFRDTLNSLLSVFQTQSIL